MVYQYGAGLMKLTKTVALAVLPAVLLCGRSYVSAQTNDTFLASDIPDESYSGETYAADSSYESEGVYGRGLFDANCDTCRAPIWYVEADALYLNRTNTRNIKLIEYAHQSHPDPPRGQREAMLTTDDLSFDYEWAPRITIGRALDSCRRIGITYYGPLNWGASRDMVAADVPAELNMPFDSNWTSDFDGASDVTVTYKSELHSVEANCIIDRGGCFMPLFGFRYYYLNEEFNYATTDGETSNYLIGTDNSLVGFQIGGMVNRQITARLSWDAAVKAGLYVNFARQHTWLGDDGNSIVLRDNVVDEGELAFASELSLGLIYQVTDCVALTAGYQVMWLEGVALAPEQLDYTTTIASSQFLNHHGGAFYDGGYLGLGISY